MTSIESGTEAQIIAKCILILETLRAQFPVKRFALAFDVDDTLIRWQDDGEGDAVAARPIVKMLYDRAVELNFFIFIITARTNTKGGLRYMVKQVEKTGFQTKGAIPNHGMYMTAKVHVDDDDPARFKSDARTHLQQKFDVEIVFMVGDKFWDMMRTRPPWLTGLDDTSMTHLIKKPDTNADYGIKLISVDGDNWSVIPDDETVASAMSAMSAASAR